MKKHLKIQTLLFLLVSFFIVSCSTDTLEPQVLSATNEVSKVKDTKTNVPTLTTTAVNDMTTNTVSSGGIIISAKGVVTAKGLVWSTLSNPTIDLTTKTTDGTGSDGFTSTLTSLSPDTTYYVRAYATNVNGTGYGNQVSFTTLKIPMSLVTIGNQTWTVANLDVTTYSDGTTIPQVTDPVAWGMLTTGAWCYYNNDPANNAVYGKLYNWYAVAGIHNAESLSDPSLRKQLAPTGYHIPTDAEWTVLTTYLGGDSVAGGAMKESGTTHWSAPNIANNSSGFTGLPGMYRYKDGSFDLSNIGAWAMWWSFTEYDTSNARVWGLVYLTSGAYKPVHLKDEGHSVRCLRN